MSTLKEVFDARIKKATTPHYAFVKWDHTILSDSNTSTEKSVTFTTAGNPVYVHLCGDTNPENEASKNGWIHAFIYRDGTLLTRQCVQNSGNSFNTCFSLAYLDTPSAGSHTYRVLIRQGCAGTTISLGEGIAKEAPQFIAFEIK